MLFIVIIVAADLFVAELISFFIARQIPQNLRAYNKCSIGTFIEY